MSARAVLVTFLLGSLSIFAGGTAWAHSSEGAFILLLPTGYYTLGGVAAVAVSFLLTIFIKRRSAQKLLAWHRAMARPFPRFPLIVSALSFLSMLWLIGIGITGTQDPLANPLPLTVWVLAWIVLTLAHALFGHLWLALNPWRAVISLLHALRIARQPLLRYPTWLGSWPAFLGLAAFAWFELISLSPQNPERLAWLLTVYFLVHLIGTMLFGPGDWFTKAETFSVFFRLVALLSPFQWGGLQGSTLTWPGRALVRKDSLDPSGVAFVILMLATVSFDGLSKTFWWLGHIGVNPLDHPGRSAVVWENSLGLVGAFLTLFGFFVLAVWSGEKLSCKPRSPTSLRDLLGQQVLAILPIAFGYHFAHYLTVLLVDLQYAALVYNDPLGRGWNLLGLEDWHVTTSFLNQHHSVEWIWRSQVAAIVIAHICGVLAAHLLTLETEAEGKTVFVTQLPMMVLMLAYTGFGLWLLASPAAG